MFVQAKKEETKTEKFVHFWKVCENFSCAWNVPEMESIETQNDVMMKRKALKLRYDGEMFIFLSHSMM